MSVLWYTEGKGDEDSGLVYSAVLQVADVGGSVLRLPRSPRYDGALLKIHWIVRLRRGKQVTEKPFAVGCVDWLSCKLDNYARKE